MLRVVEFLLVCWLIVLTYFGRHTQTSLYVCLQLQLVHMLRVDVLFQASQSPWPLLRRS